MKTQICFLIFSILYLLLISCQSPELNDKSTRTPDELNAGSESPPKSISVLHSKIPPEHCRMIAAVVTVDSDSEHPCAVAPCMVTVRVDSIIGYGSAFSPPLSKGREFEVLLDINSSSTGNLSPDAMEKGPDFPVGLTFEADIKRRIKKSGQDSKGPEFFISRYSPCLVHDQK